MHDSRSYVYLSMFILNVLIHLIAYLTSAIFRQFKLEDASKEAEPPSTPSFIRRSGPQVNSTAPRPSSAPIDTTETTNITLPLRRPKSIDEKGTIFLRKFLTSKYLLLG